MAFNVLYPKSILPHTASQSRHTHARKRSLSVIGKFKHRKAKVLKTSVPVVDDAEGARGVGGGRDNAKLVRDQRRDQELS